MTLTEAVNKAIEVSNSNGVQIMVYRKIGYTSYSFCSYNTWFDKLYNKDFQLFFRVMPY
jgi:hypothetical protein